MQKRYEVRRSTIIPTEVTAPFWDEPLDLVAADLSSRGMYLISEKMPELGDFLICSFALSGERVEYSLFSRVQRLNWHRRKTDRYRPGFGVEFVNAAPYKRMRIRTAIQGLPPPIPSRSRGNLFEAPALNAYGGKMDLFDPAWCEVNRRLLEGMILSPVRL